MFTSICALNMIIIQYAHLVSTSYFFNETLDSLSLFSMLVWMGLMFVYFHYMSQYNMLIWYLSLKEKLDSLSIFYMLVWMEYFDCLLSLHITIQYAHLVFTSEGNIRFTFSILHVSVDGVVRLFTFTTYHNTICSLGIYVLI